jgi:hypothetical protein
LTLRDRITEMMLAFHCLRLVKTNGGILEQPAFSAFWSAANLPQPGSTTTAPTLWSIAVDQSNFGHRTTKPTWLLLAHIKPEDVVLRSWSLADRSTLHLADLTPGQRSATPLPFALFLLDTASTARPPHPPPSPTPEASHHGPPRPQARD